MNTEPFISYSRADKEYVRQCVDRLKASGFPAWQDATAIRLGDSFPNAISTAVADASAGVVFWSENYEKSGWCTNELNMLFQRFTAEKMPLLVAQLDDTPVPSLIGSQIQIAVRPEPEAFADQIAGVLRERGPTAPDALAGLGTEVDLALLDDSAIEWLARELSRRGYQPRNDDTARIDGGIPAALGATERIELRIRSNSEEAFRDLESALNVLDTHNAFIRNLREKLDQGGLGVAETGHELELKKRSQRRAEEQTHIRTILSQLIVRFESFGREHLA